MTTEDMSSDLDGLRGELLQSSSKLTRIKFILAKNSLTAEEKIHDIRKILEG